MKDIQELQQVCVKMKLQMSLGLMLFKHGEQTYEYHQTVLDVMPINSLPLLLSS